jgi:hypothetical protein
MLAREMSHIPGVAWWWSLVAEVLGAGSTVAAVEFRVDGQVVGTDRTAEGGEFSYRWETHAALPGPHLLDAYGRGTSGEVLAKTAAVWVVVKPPPGG